MEPPAETVQGKIRDDALPEAHFPFDRKQVAADISGPSGRLPEKAEKIQSTAPPKETGSETLKEAVPVYRKNPSPRYPLIARRRGYEGTVILEVLVNPKGGVKDLRIFRSSRHSVLDEAAVISVRDWLFEPARRGDRNIEMWVKVPVCFKLK